MRSVKEIFLKDKISIVKILIMIVLGFMTEIAASYVVTIILDAIPGAADKYNQSIEGLITMTPQMILYVCIVAPALEELVFRGLILGISSRFIPFIYTNIIQALLFGVYHGNVTQGIYAFVLGMFIGFVSYKAGGIVYTFILHSALNLTGLYLDKIIPDSMSFLLNTIIAFLAFAIICVLVKWLVGGDNRLEIEKTY